MNHEQLGEVLEELIDILHSQAKELEKLVVRVEQVTTRLPETNRIALAASELSALHLRIKKLREAQPTTRSRGAEATV